MAHTKKEKVMTLQTKKVANIGLVFYLLCNCALSIVISVFVYLLSKSAKSTFYNVYEFDSHYKIVRTEFCFQVPKTRCKLFVLKIQIDQNKA